MQGKVCLYLPYIIIIIIIIFLMQNARQMHLYMYKIIIIIFSMQNAKNRTSVLIVHNKYNFLYNAECYEN